MSSTTQAEEVRPGVLRTPDERFENLPEFDFQPHYKDVLGYRVHYLDEGPANAAPTALMSVSSSADAPGSRWPRFPDGF